MRGPPKIVLAASFRALAECAVRNDAKLRCRGVALKAAWAERLAIRRPEPSGSKTGLVQRQCRLSQARAGSWSVPGGLPTGSGPGSTLLLSWVITCTRDRAGSPLVFDSKSLPPVPSALPPGGACSWAPASACGDRGLRHPPHSALALCFGLSPSAPSAMSFKLRPGGRGA